MNVGNAFEAINAIKQMSRKMSGLTMNEAATFDNAIYAIEVFLKQNQKPTPVDPVKAEEHRHPV